MSALEYKLAQSCTDVGDLQCKVREYEQLIEEYRSQVNNRRISFKFMLIILFIYLFYLVYH